MSQLHKFAEILAEAADGDRPELAARLLLTHGPRPAGQDANDMQWLVWALNEIEDDNRRMTLIDKVYQAHPPTAEFLDREAARMQALAEWLKGEFDYSGVKSRWKTMTEADRLNNLRLVIKKHDEIAGIDTHATIKLMYKRPRKDTVLYGDYTSGTNEIRINIHRFAKWDNFADCLSTVIHENTHHQQYMTVTALTDDKVAKTVPDFDQMRWFYVIYTHDARTSKLSHQAYLRMPHEVHARANQRALSRALSPLHDLALRLNLSKPKTPTPLLPRPKP